MKSTDRLRSARQLHQADRRREAEAQCRKIIAFAPQTLEAAEAWHLIGVIALQAKRPADAIESLRQAIVISPKVAAYHVNLANALRMSGRLAEAIDAARQATVIDPHLVVAFNLLGVALREQRQLDLAIAAFARATELAPHSADGWANLGLTLTNAGRHGESLQPLQIALAKLPNNAQLLRGLGRALHRLGDLDGAMASLEKAIASSPADAEAIKQIAMIHLQRHRPGEAISLLRQALQITPDDGYARAILGSALKDQGFTSEAMDEHERSVQLAPDVDWIGSMRLLSAHYPANSEPKNIAAMHREWAAAHAAQIPQLPAITISDDLAGRRVRVGYVSPDLRSHALSFFLSPLLVDFDRDSLEVFCYSNTRQSGPADEHTEFLARRVNGWREIHAMDDDAAARLIRDDRIDVLVDLSGHTGFSRLLIFARKPAPVQVTYLGYPNTTGMDSIDYRLTDSLADPPGVTDELNVERLIRMDGCAWCYRPTARTPSIVTPPSARQKRVTFGSFNIVPKLSDATLRLWATILRQAPASRFLFKADSLVDSVARQRIIEAFAACGIDHHRLEFRSRVPSLFDHLSCYGEIDIALDPFPYNGTTTTCDALWMGVPVITLAGKAHVSRVGVSLLNAVGLPQFIATTEDEYRALAVGLANEPAALPALRRELRERMMRSTLCDVARFAQMTAQLYRNLCGG